MKFICLGEMLSGRTDPNYDGIVDHLKVAVAEVTRETGQKKFEWLESALPVTFGVPGVDRPNGKRDPDWFKEIVKKGEKN